MKNEIWPNIIWNEMQQSVTNTYSHCHWDQFHVLRNSKFYSRFRNVFCFFVLFHFWESWRRWFSFELSCNYNNKEIQNPSAIHFEIIIFSFIECETKIIIIKKLRKCHQIRMNEEIQKCLRALSTVMVIELINVIQFFCGSRINATSIEGKSRNNNYFHAMLLYSKLSGCSLVSSFYTYVCCAALVCIDLLSNNCFCIACSNILAYERWFDRFTYSEFIGISESCTEWSNCNRNPSKLGSERWMNWVTTRKKKYVVKGHRQHE